MPGAPGRYLTIGGTYDPTVYLYADSEAQQAADPARGDVPRGSGPALTAIVMPGAQAPRFARGTWCVPPLEFWHFLTVRDQAGSAALRSLDGATAAALLERSEGGAPQAAAAAVLDLLPQLTHPALQVGVAGYLEVAQDCQARIGLLAQRLQEAEAELAAAEAAARAAARADADGSAPFATSRISADDLNDAVRGLVQHPQLTEGSEPFEGLVRRFAALLGAAEPPTEDELAAVFGTGEARLSALYTLGEAAVHLPAIAYRAASPAFPEGLRAAALDLLDAFDGAGLTAPGSALRYIRVSGQRPRGAKPPTFQQRRSVVAPAATQETETGRLLIFPEYAQHQGMCQALEFSRTGAFAAPPGRSTEGEHRSAAWPWSKPDGLRAFRAAVREHGPAPLTDAAVDQLVDLTGLLRDDAALILAGMPHDLWIWGRSMSPECTAVLAGLGVKQAAAKRAAERLNGGRRVSKSSRLLSALLPAEPDALWSTQADLSAEPVAPAELSELPKPAEPAESAESAGARRPKKTTASAPRSGPAIAVAAAVWNSAEGRLSPLPPQLIPLIKPPLTPRIVQGLLDPAKAPWFGPGVLPGGDGTLRGDLGQGPLLSSATALLWLAYTLPAGDPLRARLPDAVHAVTRYLAHPKLSVHLGYVSGEVREQAVAALGVEERQGGQTDQWRVGPLQISERHSWGYLAVLPAALTGPQDPALDFCAGVDGDGKISLLRLLLGPELAQVAGFGLDDEAARAAPYPYQDPTRSVPDLVAEAAAYLGLDADAAALYLMLLALPDPTDRNQAAWTGWPAARLKAARERLAAATDPDGEPLLVTGSRPRAGRSLFLPGTWIALGTPNLPLEQWKAPQFGVTAQGLVQYEVTAPIRPVPELFRDAWRRIRTGDKPRYADLAVPAARRGRARG